MGQIKFNGNTLDPATISALVSGTLVEGHATAKWWKLQSDQFLNSFTAEIKTAMQNGESVTQAITRVTGGTVSGITVPGIMKTSKAKAGALVSTAINRVSNEAALQSFQVNSDVIKWVTQVSTLDNRTSLICIGYSGKTWELLTLKPVLTPTSQGVLPFNGGPPRHFNCRSRLRPVTKSFSELGIPGLPDDIPAGTRASMDGQVAADITFDAWLRKKGLEFQNKLLGQKRAELYRQQKITLTQLVDMRGNPLSLTQLEQRIGIKPKVDPLARAKPKIAVQDPEAGFKAALAAAEEKAAVEKAARIAAERKAAREAAKKEAARKAKRKAEQAAKKAADDAAAAEAERKAAQLAKEKAEADAAAAKKAASIDAADVVVVEGNSIEAQIHARVFLVRNGITVPEITQFGGSVSLLDSFNPIIARNLLAQIRGNIKRAAAEAKKIAGIEHQAIPKFKNVKEAEAWTRANLVNTLNNPVAAELARKGPRTVRRWKGRGANREIVTDEFGDIVGYAGYKPELFRYIAEFTQTLSQRFKAKLPNYIGLKKRHPTIRFRGGNELASVHMETDSLLLPTTITNEKKLLERWFNSESYQSRKTLGRGGPEALERRAIRDARNLESITTQFETMLVDAEQAVKEGVPHAKQLVKAIKKSLKEKDFTWTVRIPLPDDVSDKVKAIAQMWKTVVHESGHRLHAQFGELINPILRELRDSAANGGSFSRSRYVWARQTSEYAASNDFEFVAESFVRYIIGDHDRIYPPLLKAFKQLDSGGGFGITEISKFIKELLP